MYSKKLNGQTDNPVSKTLISVVIASLLFSTC